MDAAVLPPNPPGPIVYCTRNQPTSAPPAPAVPGATQYISYGSDLDQCPRCFKNPSTHTAPKLDETPATRQKVNALAGLLTGLPWPVYYAVLWLVPLGTSFSFCMLLRQIVQHGHAGRERFTNTRIFLVSRLIRFAVFPLGMDWHLPHHLFPLVPHYRLRQLHELLLETDEYRQNATTVEGYFWHRDPPEHPTVLELMAADRRP